MLISNSPEEHPQEDLLPMDYPVYGSYLYVFDSLCGQYKNAVWANDLFRSGLTVSDLIADLQEYLKVQVVSIKRCNIVARGLM